MRLRPDHAPRSRWRLLAAILVVIPLGLLSRADLALPAFVVAHAGDALWALLVYLLVALLRPSFPAWQIGLAALGFAFAIELSQLYQAPWIDALRATLPGRLVLGQGFLWVDLLRYSAGVAAGIVLDGLLRAPRSRR